MSSCDCCQDGELETPDTGLAKHIMNKDIKYDTQVVIEDWKEQIETAFYAKKDWNINFHAKIWEMSMTAFDKPREVQVVIDSNDKLFISVGDGSFVSFDGQEGALKGMKLPLQEWIHTHPFGAAYFSGTDLRTISIWERYLESATVIGKDEEMKIFFRVGPNGEHFQEYSQFAWVGDEEE